MRINVSPEGQLTLPDEVRARLGLSAGGVLSLVETPDGLHIRTAMQSVTHARELAEAHTGGKAGTSVKNFLANRRQESGE